MLRTKHSLIIFFREYYERPIVPLLDMLLLLDFMFMQISRDCQELEPFIGEQLASLLYLEPDSQLMVCYWLFYISFPFKTFVLMS